LAAETNTRSVLQLLRKTLRLPSAYAGETDFDHRLGFDRPARLVV
jgi:hypothetical protein